MGVIIGAIEYRHRHESDRPSSNLAGQRRSFRGAIGRARSSVSVYRLTGELRFPAPEDAEPNGLLAVGGDLGAERLLLAYSMGIFPWYEDGLPVLWHSPDPRTILLPSQLRVSRSLRKVIRDRTFEIRCDGDFEAVIRACARAPRNGQDGTWITDEMVEGYLRLFELGYAHCSEAWSGDELVGGLYGVSLGGCFFGESMFASCANASKVAFVALVEQLARWEFDLIDCQVHTDHLARFGATEWPRGQFLSILERSLAKQTRRGRWRFDGEG
jgi:leucyl/phenylalanyl-tRNA--protein transferase